jgi:uncharacterized protein YbcI
VNGKTRGESEAEFTNMFIKLERDYLGRGPEDVRTFFVNDMIVVRLRGIETAAEIKLAETVEGSALVKDMRRQLFESSKPILQEIVNKTIGCGIEGLYTDMNPHTGERIVVLTVDMNLDKLFG